MKLLIGFLILIVILFFVPLSWIVSLHPFWLVLFLAGLPLALFLLYGLSDKRSKKSSRERIES
jgi:hypothetical protein